MSAMRALLFDIGNTRVKWAVLDRGRLGKVGSIGHEQLRESGFGALTAHLPRDVDTVLASNTAGQTFATRLSGIIGIHCDREVHFARAERRGFGVTNGYRNPRRMGVDRWVAMVGAKAEFGGALCVVDAGTAVTIDALDRDGLHLGGLILPGLRLMREALHVNTSDLPPAKRIGGGSTDGMELFATTTDAALDKGAMAAVCGAIERAVARMRAAGHRPKLVLTGGDASRIVRQLEGEVLHRPNLVLQGLARMVQGDERR
ncbi:MAG TPA: type III pantothenate kinase [Woeseiaceae bacterium]|nr:type III pantothenate kinase [Woeseiaceae bacterium]